MTLNNGLESATAPEPSTDTGKGSARVPETTPLRADVLGGLTTFVTMAYIIVVNPAVLHADGATGLPFSGVMTATVVLAFSMTLLMGLFARLPFAVAPGMGMNAYLTYGVILGRKVPWPQALGMVFWSGALFLALSATPLREQIARAIPRHLRAAAGVGIGVFLSFIGLKNAGLVAADPVTFVKAAPLSTPSVLAVSGLFIAFWLVRRRNPFAFLASIFLVTLAGAALGQVTVPARLLSTPDFSSVFFKVDVLGALRLAFAPVIVSVALSDLFESLATLVSVSRAGELTDSQGEPRRLKQALIVDACATFFAGLFGTSPGTIFLESAAGVEVGARTGRAAVVTALCFLPCLFLAPIAGMVPAYATAPVLLLVGAFMFRSLAGVPMARVEEVVPAFLVIVLIPLTFSITQGLLWGFIAHVVCMMLARRARELTPMMLLIGVLSALLLVLESF